MIVRTVLLLALGLSLAGCNVRHDRQLVSIAETVSDFPREAISKLNEIPDSTLSMADRHYRDFLALKATDKAYIVHKSDSLFLDLFDYYSSHDRENIYPEVLYYGGRVYSDLGDYPTALRHFQQALDAIPANSGHEKLRSAVLSQTGRLLEKLRLYDEAVPLLEEAVSLNSTTGDRISLSSNLELLGVVYKYLKQYDRAAACFNKSIEIHSTSHMAKVHMAEIESAKGNIAKAVSLIRNMVDSVEDVERPYVMATSAMIYYKAGLMDSILPLATKLTLQKDNNHIGYYILTREDLKDHINADSLYSYIRGYVSNTEKRLDDIMREKILLQTTSYNYQKHEQDKNNLLEENIKLKNRLIGYISAFFIILILFLLIIVYKTRNQLILARVLDNIRQIRFLNELSSHDNKHPHEPITDNREWTDDTPIDTKEQEPIPDDSKPGDDTPIDTKEQEPVPDDSGPGDDTPIDPEKPEPIPDDSNEKNEISLTSNKTMAEIKKSIQRYLADLEMADDKFYLSDSFFKSEIYSDLNKLLSSKKPIPENSELWSKIENKISEVSPNFKKNLLILTDGKLKFTDYQLAMLIKCGLNTTQMGILLSRAKNTISTRKDSLSKKIFKDNRNPKDIEILIHSL